LEIVSLEKARLLNLLTMVRDMLYRYLRLPAFEASVAGRVRVEADMLLPTFNIVSGRAFRRRVHSLRVISRHGSLYVEPLPEAGIAPIAVYGPSRLYTLVYGGLLLSFNSEAVERVFRAAGDRSGSLYSFYEKLAGVVAEWYRALPRVDRPLSPIYAARIDVDEADAPASLQGRCGSLQLVGYVDPSAPVDRGVRLECDGERLSLQGVGDEWLSSAYDALAERVREDLTLIEGLYDKLSQMARGRPAV
jgi:hypothetical protein